MPVPGRSTSPFPDEPESHGARHGTRSRPFSVSELNRAGREILEADLSSIFLVGEISNFKAHSSGHWYFSLKDDRAQVSAAMFRYANSRVRARPADGMKVLVSGTATLYEARGQYQVVAETLEPVGVGDLQAAFEELKRKLREEGLFDEDRKRPLPALPTTVGVATSPTGAAIRDILRVFERRGADLRVLVAPCRVQGEGAAAEIVRALRLLNSRREVEAIILGRGGGSLEDLWAFNEEPVARAIAASRAPVVSGVGHEVDFTISDFVADLRAATPSAAAERVLKSRDELYTRLAAASTGLLRSTRLRIADLRSRLERSGADRSRARIESALRESLQMVDDLSLRLRRAAEGGLAGSRADLDLLVQRLSPRSLRAEVQSKRERLASASALAGRAARSRIAALRESVARTAGVLQSLSPLAVLERGYAICHDAEKGTVLRTAERSLEGRDVRVKLSRGSLLCQVRKAEPTGS